MLSYLYNRLFKPSQPHEVIEDLLEWQAGDALRLRDSSYVTMVPIVPKYIGADETGIFVEDEYGEFHHVSADLASKAYYNRRLSNNHHISELNNSEYNKLLLDFQKALSELRQKNEL